MLNRSVQDNVTESDKAMACEAEQTAATAAAEALVLATVAKAEADAGALIKQLEWLAAVAAYQVAEAALNACLIANPAPPGGDPPPPAP